jgi:hypothetical protein
MNFQQQYAVWSHVWLSALLKEQETSRRKRRSMVVLLLSETGCSSSSGHCAGSTADERQSKKSPGIRDSAIQESIVHLRRPEFPDDLFPGGEI